MFVLADRPEYARRGEGRGLEASESKMFINYVALLLIVSIFL
jgi:hypothetical protein